MRAPRVQPLLRRALVFAMLVLPLGCVNPFKPADPERPSGKPVLENFGTPEELLETMRLGIESRSTSGADAYLHALAESTAVGDRAFRAFYDPAVKAVWQSGNPGVTAPEPWDLTLERNLPPTLNDIRPTAPEYVFQWEPDPLSQADDPFTADTAQIHRKYTLFATTEGGDVETIGIGFADLSLQKERSGRWSVFRWHDRVDPDVGVNPAETDQRSFSWWRLESLIRTR